MQLTDEIIKYANKYLDCKIGARHIAYATKEDREDIKSFCLQRLVKYWAKYDCNKSSWKTFLITVLKTALADGLRWHYRQHQRNPDEPLEEAQDVVYEDISLYDIIDDVLDNDLAKQVCKLKMDGTHALKIMSILHISKEQYDEALDKLHKALNKKEL